MAGEELRVETEMKLSTRDRPRLWMFSKGFGLALRLLPDVGGAGKLASDGGAGKESPSRPSSESDPSESAELG